MNLIRRQIKTDAKTRANLEAVEYGVKLSQKIKTA